MIDCVTTAKNMGLYTIVTDWNDTILSPAKLIADEVWNISWNDIDTLTKKCKECNVSGVFGGYSEFVVDSVIALCDNLNLPCYITKQQLEVTRDKSAFKKFCQQHHVAIVKECDPKDVIKDFPVIVKPVDRAGSIGINTAYNKQEYEQYLKQAYDL
jgi:biotin carboxylase